MTLPVAVTIGGAGANEIDAGWHRRCRTVFFQINAAVPTSISPSSDALMVLTVGAASTAVPVAIR